MENNLKKQTPPPPSSHPQKHLITSPLENGGRGVSFTCPDGVSRKYASDQLILASPNVKTKRIPALCEKCTS